MTPPATVKDRGGVGLGDCRKQARGRFGGHKIQTRKARAVTYRQTISGNAIAIEPGLYDGDAGFIITPLAILSRVGIGRERTLLFPEGAKNQLGIEVVTFFVCLANDLAEGSAFCESDLESFLRIELLAFRGAKVTTARFAFNLDALFEQRVFEKRGRPARRVVD